MILLESPLVKVEFDKTVPCVMWTPLEYMTGDDFREPILLALNSFVEHIKELPSMGWISDSRLSKAVKPDDIIWAVQNVNSVFAKAGGKKIAFVLPEDPFAKIGLRLYVQYTRKSLEHTLQVKVFKNVDDAKSWIKGINISSIEEVRI